MGKKILSASVGGPTTADPYADARRINSMSRDALPAVPIGDVGYGQPSAEGRFAESDRSIPAPQQTQDAGFEGVAPQASHADMRRGMMGTSVAQARVEHRKPSDQELMAKAMEMLDRQSNQHQALLTQPSLSPRDASGSLVTDANGQKLPDWLVREQEGR